MKFEWRKPQAKIFKAETAGLMAAVIEIGSVVMTGEISLVSALRSLAAVAVIYLAAYVTVPDDEAETADQ